MRTRLACVVVAGVGLAGPGQAVAGTAGTADCTRLLAPNAPVERPVQIGGHTVFVRDPYGGLVSRNRLFIAFGVRYPTPEARAAVASIQWLVDGAPPARNAGGPNGGLSFQSTRLTAGDHVITAVLTPAGGGTARSVDVPVTATDCQLTRIFPTLVNGRTRQPAEIQVTGGGPSLETVSLRATGLRASIPSSLRGRRVGTLVLREVDEGGDIDDVIRRFTLRAPRSARGRSIVLLRRSGLTVRLRTGSSGTLIAIRGLPDETPAVELDLARGVLSVRRPCPVPRVTARLTGGDGPAASVTSGIEVNRNC